MIAMVHYPYDPHSIYNRNQLGAIGSMPWLVLGAILLGIGFLGTKRTGKLF